MTRLLMVELVRFRSRRAIALLALATLVVAAVLVAMAAYQTRPLTQEDRANAAAQAALEGQKPERRAEVRACRSDPQAYLGTDATGADCATRSSSRPRATTHGSPWRSAKQWRDRRGGRPRRGRPARDRGSTFAGAEWTSGSMTNQLLFEPRRTRVWRPKQGL